MTMMDERQLIPEEKCAHRELEHVRGPGRAMCHDCGFMQDVLAMPTVGQAELEKAEEKAYDDGFADGKAEGIGSGTSDLEETVVAFLGEWRGRLLRVADAIPEGVDLPDDFHAITDEMQAWRA